MSWPKRRIQIVVSISNVESFPAGRRNRDRITCFSSIRTASTGLTLLSSASRARKRLFPSRQLWQVIRSSFDCGAPLSTLQLASSNSPRTGFTRWCSNTALRPPHATSGAGITPVSPSLGRNRPRMCVSGEKDARMGWLTATARILDWSGHAIFDVSQPN